MNILDESYFDQQQEVYENLIKIYSKGDVYEIEKYIGDFVDDPIMVSRNKVMVNSMIDIMQTKTLFSAVGAAHLPGKNGIIKMLMEKGYKISPVEATFSGIAEKYTIDFNKMKWQKYQNENFGIELEVPTQMIDFEISDEFESTYSIDMISGAYYGLITIALPLKDTNPEYEQVLLESIISNIESNENQSIISKKVVETPVGSTIEMIMEIDNLNVQKVRYYVRNGYVFGLTIGNSEKVIKQDFVNRYFDSIRFFEPKSDNSSNINRSYKEEKETTATVFTKLSDSKAAFSVDMPSNYEKRTISQPLEIENEMYNVDLNLFISTDLNTLTNYIVRYNDFPNGLYLSRTNDSYKDFLSELGTAGQLIGTIDTVWINGFEGRQFDIDYKGYFSKGQLFFRGNRVYLLLQQNLDKNNREISDLDFFNSFSFEPYQSDTLQWFESEDFGFKIKTYSEVESETDSDDIDLGTQKTLYLNSKNPYTGGSFMNIISEVSPFYKIDNLDSFYVALMNHQYLGHNDTIIKIETITIQDNIIGKEIHLLEADYDVPLVYRLFVHDRYIYQLAATGAKEDIFGQTTKDYFDSFTIDKSNSTFDIFASKTESILDGILSSDTTLFNESYNAILNYYTFNENDILPILETIKQRLSIDDEEYSVANILFDEISSKLNESHLPILKEIYLASDHLETIQSNILSDIPTIDSINGYDMYVDLIVNHPPKHVNSWMEFYPLKDSLDIAASYFNDLLPLMEDEDRVYQMLSLSNEMLKSENLKYQQIVHKHFPTLIKNAPQYLSDLYVQIDTSEAASAYSMYVDEIIELIKNNKDSEFGQDYLNEIVNIDCSSWLKVTAVDALIERNWKVDPTQINELLSNQYIRISLMETILNTPYYDNIPVTYKNQDSFVEVILNNYMEDDYYPDTTFLIGEIIMEDSLYYTYEYEYNTENDLTKSYTIAIGPFDPQKKILNFDYYFYDSYEMKEEDWKMQIKERIKNRNSYLKN